MEEGNLMPDHVHMLLSVPPEHAVSQVVGYLKGKSVIHLARIHGGRRRKQHQMRAKASASGLCSEPWRDESILPAARGKLRDDVDVLERGGVAFDELTGGDLLQQTAHDLA